MALRRNYLVNLGSGNATVSAVAAQATAAFPLPNIQVEGDLEGWYVSPTGSSTGAGTIGDPWDLWTAMNRGGYPAGTIQPGDTIWLRGGTHVPWLTTANMQGTVIDPVMVTAGDRTIWSSTNPWVPGDVGKSITVYGVYTNGTDMVTTISGYNSPDSVETTYTPVFGYRFICDLNGSAGNYITFRGYPGERATIDSNADPDFAVGLYQAGIVLSGSYLILRDVEVTNSKPQRSTPYIGSNPPKGRDSGITISGSHIKVINVVGHDVANTFGTQVSCSDVELYGNIALHGGFISPMACAFAEVAVDLAPAGGSPVQLSGSQSHGKGSSGTTPPFVATVSHTQPANTSNPFLVVAATAQSSEITNLSATYDGVAMTMMNQQHAVVDQNPILTSINGVTLFGIAGHEGTHNVVVTDLNGNKNIRCIVQSFINVHQTTPYTAKGWVQDAGTNVLEGFPRTNTVTSAANHMIVEGCYWAGTPHTNLTVEGDNTQIEQYIGVGSQVIAMGYAAGAASVAMAWQWVADRDVHAHGYYAQHLGSAVGVTIRDNITYDHIGDCCIQAYGSGSSGFTYGQIEYNVWANKMVVLGGSGGTFQIQGTNFVHNYAWSLSALFIGYKTNDISQFAFTQNYMYGTNLTQPEKDSARANCIINDNVFMLDETGVINFDDSHFTPTPNPANSYYPLGSYPLSNVVVVRPNAYEANRANIIVYNWENLTSVSVDLDGVVADGTDIYILHAQDYFGTPVVTTTYQTGTPVSIPMTNLTVMPVIGDDATHYSTEFDIGPTGTTGPYFGAFVVRAQSAEAWR